MSVPAHISQDRHLYIGNVAIPKTTLLFGIILLGLGLRLFFTYALADDFHYFNSRYEFSDTRSFTEGFINFWERGKYTHNTHHPEASFGRLPGYPAFYGIHYVLFGKELSFPATAFTQILLDVVAIWLMFRILKKITGYEKIAFAGALVYSCYPFVIYWNPYVSTESVGCFIVLLWLHQLCYYNEKKSHYFLLGMICAAALFIRVYLGILIAMTLLTELIYFRDHFKKLFLSGVYIVMGFTVLYIGWPIRNYIQFEKIILTRPSSAGYDNYSKDMVGYTMFYHCWSQDDNVWYDSLFTTRNTIFPAEVFSSKQDEQLAQSLLQQMKDCGTSYNNWMFNTPYPDAPNCNEEIHDGFQYLRNQYIKAHPYTYFVEVPAKNLKKAFFKMHPEKNAENYRWIYYTAFSYRSLMVILGFIGLWYIKKYKLLTPAFLFSVFMYIYICFYHRSLEMRYLIQADVLLLIPATISIYELYQRFIKPKQASGIPQKENFQIGKTAE